MSIKLHPQLEQDCIPLGVIGTSQLLLHKNALVPWFIIVPDTHLNEIYKLELSHQQSIHSEINQIARFVENYFSADKLNIASIGNIVPQLHIHIIARHIDDFCWPKPVWGQDGFQAYKESDVTEISTQLIQQAIIKTP